MAKDTDTVNEGARLERRTVGFRLREDLHPLLDALARRHGFKDRAAMLEAQTLNALEREFPGCTSEAA